MAGLRTQGRSLLSALGSHQWPSACVDRLATWLGGTPFLSHADPVLIELHCGFTATLLCPQSSATVDLVRSILDGSATDRPAGVGTLAAAHESCRETHALCMVAGCMFKATQLCERLCDDPDLTRRYAERLLRWGASSGLIAASTLALLGRLAARRGYRRAAVKRWRQAAADAMARRFHLYALTVGWACGGAEGRAICHAACAAMGRSEEEILEEFRDAGAVFDGGLTAASVVISEAATAQGGGPERRAEEAERQTGTEQEVVRMVMEEQPTAKHGAALQQPSRATRGFAGKRL